MTRSTRAAVLVPLLQASTHHPRYHQQQVLRLVHLWYHRTQRHHDGSRVSHDAVGKSPALRRLLSPRHVMPNTQSRRRRERDSTRQLRRVGGVYWALASYKAM